MALAKYYEDNTEFTLERMRRRDSDWEVKYLQDRHNYTGYDWFLFNRNGTFQELPSSNSIKYVVYENYILLDKV